MHATQCLSENNNPKVRLNHKFSHFLNTTLRFRIFDDLPRSSASSAIPCLRNPKPNLQIPPKAMSTTLLLSIFVLLLLLLTPITSATTTIGLDSFLSSQSLLDPLASNDSFSLLPSSVKKSLQAQTLTLTLNLQIYTPVHVKLAGPFSSAAPSLLVSFISAAASVPSRFSVIGSKPNHHLSIAHSLNLNPSHSPLGFKISAAIKSYIESSTQTVIRSHLHSVPYSVVDDIIRQDFEQEYSGSAPGIYIYLLNLDPQSKPYAYSYDGRDASPHFSKCLGSIWTAQERYIWIDLAAGPVDYGPALSGDGLLPRGEFHPLASLHKKPRSERALIADLGSLVLSAYQSLVVPSLRTPVHSENLLLVQFVHIHGLDAKDSKVGLDFGFVEKTIRESELSFKDQELKFRSFSVWIDECSICSFAVAKAMNSYTARFLFENYTLIVSEYLDSKQLRHVLSESVDEIHRAAGIGEEEFGKVLPVYVFDLDYDKHLMLDRFHQAVAFRDMVIAVRTRVSQTVSDYSCNGRHVITQTRILDRPIVGSILQSMWGVAPNHLSWSLQHNSTLVDYTWSVGQTPFGPFSESSSLSFVQRDAAKRNVLLASLNYTISSAVEVLESMMLHGGDRKLLKGNKHVEFEQRWNLLKFKLDKVVALMSHLDYEKARYYLRSSDHDLYAIHSLVYQATQNLDAALVCFKDPSFPWVSVSVSAAFVSGFLYIYAKKDKIFRSKRKQF